MYSQPSRPTTGLLFITSICIHILVLCALLLSWHVNNLIHTKRLMHIIPPTSKPARVIFQQSSTTKSNPSITQNQSGLQQQKTEEQVRPTTTQANDTQQTARALHAMSNLEIPLEKQIDVVCVKEPTVQGDISFRNQRAEPSCAGQPVQKITMRDITKGFLRCVEREQRTTLEKRQLDSTEQMVRESYEMKVMRQFQKSVLLESRPINMTQSISTGAEVALIIDKKGAIIGFEFNHALAKQDLVVVEKFLKHAAYSTGLYPSFPRALAQEKLRISLPLYIQVTRGKHSYVITTNYR